MDLPNNIPLANISYQNGVFMCKKCPYSSKEASILREHIKQHEERQRETFQLRRHIAPNLKTVHNCDICHLSFANNYELQQHNNPGHCKIDLLNNRPLINCSYKNGLFMCKKCPYSSKKASIMREHTKHHEERKGYIGVVHVRENNFNCDICNHSFANNYKVQRHKNSVHFKIRPHKCKTCGYSASRVEHLKEHEITAHGSPEPNEQADSANLVTVGATDDLKTVPNCDICHRLFANSSKLQRHKNSVHFKIREHKCVICDYSATRLEHLKSHKVSAHGMLESNEQAYHLQFVQDPLAITLPNNLQMAEDYKQAVKSKKSQEVLDAEREARREYERNRKRDQRARETKEEKEARLLKRREVRAKSLHKEPREHNIDQIKGACKLEYDRNLKRAQRANETPHNREARLEKMRQYSAERRANNPMKTSAKVKEATRERVAAYRSKRTLQQIQRDRESAKERMGNLRRNRTGEMQIKIEPEGVFALEAEQEKIFDSLTELENQSEKSRCDLCGICFTQRVSLLEHKNKVHFRIKDCQVLLTRVKLKDEKFQTIKEDRKISASIMQKAKQANETKERRKVILPINAQFSDVENDAGERKRDQKAKEPLHAIKEEALLHMKTDYRAKGSKEMNIVRTGGIICSQCGFVFPAREDLRTHLKTIHPETYYMFQVMSNENDLEAESENRGKEGSPDDLSGEGCLLKYTEGAILEDLENGTTLTPKYISKYNDEIDSADEIFSTSVKEEGTTEKAEVFGTCVDKGKDEESSQVSDYKIVYEHTQSRVWACEKCEYSCNKRSNLKSHVERIHERVKRYKCDTCEFASYERRKVIMHRRAVHDKIKDFICDICNQAFTLSHDLNKHRAKKHGIVPNYKCELCEHTESTLFMLKMHIKKAHGVVMYKCEKCEFKSSNKKRLIIHDRAVHEKLKDHVCDICNQTFSRLDTLTRHMREQQHAKIKGENNEESEDTETRARLELSNGRSTRKEKNTKHFNCEICGYKSYKRREVDIHKRAVHDKIRSYTCNICCKTFGHHQNLNRHKNDKHAEKAKKDQPTTNRWICDECGYAAALKSGLAQHVKSVHLKIREWACDMCGYAASLKKTLMEHVHSIHWKSRSFKCEKCEFATSSRKSLTRHVRGIHLKIKDFKCDVCDYASVEKKSVDNHRRAIHRGDMADSDKALFIDKEELTGITLEETTSPVIKEWVCDMCGYVAAQKSSLVEHVHNVHWKGNLLGTNTEKLGEHDDIHAEGAAAWEGSITDDAMYWD